VTSFGSDAEKDIVLRKCMLFLLYPGTALKVFVHCQENLTFSVSQRRTEFDGAVMNILFSDFLPFFLLIPISSSFI